MGTTGFADHAGTPGMPGTPGTPGERGTNGAKGSPAGALWTVGLGVFLLVAAAATFVAVQWDRIPDGAKLGALVAITAGCIAARARLRAGLPITAAALFHVGVLLVPIDVAALGVRAGWDWPRMLFALGLTATVAFGAAAVTERSVVLRWATGVAVVALAGGVGAVTDLPAGLLLATTALAAAAVAPRSRPGDHLEWAAGGWALLAGYATPLALADPDQGRLREVVTALGLVGEGAPTATAWATGVVAAVALGVLAHRHRQPLVALAGLGAALVGAGTTWASLALDEGTDLLLVALAVLAAQAAHRARRHDPFWGGVTGVVAELAMVPAIVVTLGLAWFVLLAPALDDPLPSPAEGLAALAMAAAWLVTVTHRVTGGRSLTAAAVAGAAAVPLLAGHADVTAPVALTGLVTVALLLAPRWPGVAAHADQGAAALLLAAAPASASGTDPVAITVALVGALTLAEAAVHASRRETAAAPPPPPPPAATDPGSGTGSARPGDGPWAPVGVAPGTPRPAPWPPARAPRRAGTTAARLAAWSLVPPIVAALAVTGGRPALGRSLALVTTGWLLALVLDRADQAPGREPLSLLPRCGMVAALVTTLGLTSSEAVAAAALVAGLLLLDAVRRSEPVLLVGVAAATPMAVAHLALANGWAPATAGVAVTASGVVWLGLAGVLPGRWAPPALVGAVIAAGAGLCLTSDDTTAFAVNLLVVGLAVAAVGLLTGEHDVALAGGLIATVAVWGLLDDAGIRALDAYAAPVAVVLLGAGIALRRDGQDGQHGQHGQDGQHERAGDGVRASSWRTLAPPVVLLGGAALAERLAGAPAGHAALAGAVGVAAVTAGAIGRWAGPLFTGTVLVVAVTVHETLGVTAQLPTWAWLAAGGVALLAAGTTMERRGVGPVETGRRLVDVVAERFD